MEETRQQLRDLGLPSSDAHGLPTSRKRFEDGAQVRIEIPSVEGPRALAAVIEAAEKYGVPIHRVSQGSGVMMLTDSEITDMVDMSRAHGIELSLFVGPRGTWDINASQYSDGGKGQGQRLCGMDQVVYAVEDIKRGCGLGLRGVLIADEGLLWVVDQLKRRAALPADLSIKTSVSLGASNPASVRLLEQSGASTLNLPTSLTLPAIGAIREAVSVPLDIYVESPDDFGGFVRLYEIANMARLAAPVYLKFGLRNAANVYPSGLHLDRVAVDQCREKVRRASLGLQLLRKYLPDVSISASNTDVSQRLAGATSSGG